MRTVVLMSHAGFRLWLDMLDEALRDCLELDPGNATLLAQQEVSRKLRAGEVLGPADFKVMGWDMPDTEALREIPISLAFGDWKPRRESLHVGPPAVVKPIKDERWRPFEPLLPWLPQR